MLSQHREIMSRALLSPSITAETLHVMITNDIDEVSKQALDDVADRVTGRVRRIVSGEPPHIFKIGLTRDPTWRFHDAPFAYHPEFRRMEVLVVSCTAAIQYLEAAVIDSMKGALGCRNVAPGGESPPPDDVPSYIYVVWVSVSDFTEARLRNVRRKEVRFQWSRLSLKVVRQGT